MTSRINQPTLHHVNLKTTRLQEMIDWYGTVVGSRPNFQFPGGAWLTRDGANHRIALLRWIDEGPSLTGKCIRHHIWRHRGSATGRPAPKPS